MRIRLFTLLLLGLLSSQPGTAADQGEWLSSVDKALAKASDEDRLILVDLYADWCGWCKKLEEEVFSSPAFQEFTRDFVLLRVDTEDGGEGTRLQQKFDAYSLPTTLILDSDKVKIGEVMGFAPTERFIASIQKEIQSFDELVQGFERFGQTEDLRVLGILADEFHKRNDGNRAAALSQKMLATQALPRERAVLVQYQLTDSLRLAGRYDEARLQLRDSRVSAVEVGNADLVERLDLLGAQLALDRGDCQGAETALEDFLGNYRKSPLRRHASKTLASIRADGFQCL